MQSAETSGKTRQEAIQKALDELGVDMAEVEIEILDEGSSGIFGFGKRDVRVKVIAKSLPDKSVKPKKHAKSRREEKPRKQEKTKKQEKTARQDKGGKKQDDRSRKQKQKKQEKASKKEKQPERQEQKTPKEEKTPRREKKPAIPLEPVSAQQQEEAVALLDETIRHLGIEATVTGELMEDGGLKLNVESPDSAVLIGHKGRNLQALQYLINRMARMSGNAEGPERIVVDIERYLERRRASLEEMALQLAQKAKETQREIRLKPLSSQERRIVHLVLQDDPEIRTFSTGNSPMRSVVISPKNATRREGRSRRGGGGRRGNRSRGNRQSAPQEAPAPLAPAPEAEQEAPVSPAENQNETVESGAENT